MGRSNRILKNLSYVTVVVAIAKILGFVRQLIAANAFGATLHTDLISLSEGLISNVDYLLIQTFATAFVPIYLQTKSNSEDRESEYVSSTLKLILLLTLGIVALVEIAAPLIAKVLAPKYTAEISALLARYLRIVAPSIVFLVLTAFYGALLKSNEAFVHAELTNVYQSLIAILLVLLIGAWFGPDTLILAFLAAALLNACYLAICARKYWHIQAGNPFRNEDVRSMLRMIVPLLFGYAMVFINQQIDKIIVS
ncbi:MAG: oligosaccharide flippase family protein, partial [Clostridia bacterium]|nr:oligosaccharide flippase family protein [Clostridia bacterium]